MIEKLVTVYRKTKSRPMIDRIIMGLSGLLFIFVTPITMYRLANQDWDIFFVDLFLISSAALIYRNTFLRKHIEFSRIYLCVLVTIGSSMSVIVGGSAQFYWVYPSSVTMFFLVSNKIAFGLVLLICLLTFPVLQGNLQSMELATAYLALFGTSMFVYVFSNEAKSENSNLDSLANMDFLTSCGNRRAFDIELNNKIQRKNDIANTTCLIILDIDDFKVLNDNYGHIMGDQVLKDLSQSIRSRLRKSDNLYRLGGEEFGIIISNLHLQEAEQIASELMYAISSQKQEELPNYTVSMGIAELQATDTYESFIERSDQAMYNAKRTGKDRIVLATL